MKKVDTYNTIKVKKLNEVYLRLECEDCILRELSEIFTFFVPNHTFNPMFRNKMWDGKIRLLHYGNRTLPQGLLQHLQGYCIEKDYFLDIDSEIADKPSFSNEEAREYFESLNVHSKGKKLEIRDYQQISVAKSLRHKRKLLLSPTGSGKSLILYLLARYITEELGLKVLLIVPTINLVGQMYTDFQDYASEVSWSAQKSIHKVYEGQEKSTNLPITISTWQSLYGKVDASFYKDFGAVFVDEAHLAKAKSISTILQSCVNAEYRIGTTGTLDGTKTHKLVLEGLLGPVLQLVTTAELIERKQLSEFKIKCLVLKYPDEFRKNFYKVEYQEELDFIVQHEPRNRFIKNLALSLKGNTLILFRFVEKHGKVLMEMFEDSNLELPPFYIDGSISADDRNDIRSMLENVERSITVASFGTFSTGVNVTNLHNVIFANPYKGKIMNLQSIGRTLRPQKGKTATLYDIVDDLRWKEKDNFAIKHFIERAEIYKNEKFPFQMYNIELTSKE